MDLHKILGIVTMNGIKDPQKNYVVLNTCYKDGDIWILVLCHQLEHCPWRWTS